MKRSTRRGARGLAWQNVMVAAINAALERGLFSLDPDDPRWPAPVTQGRGDKHLFPFTYPADGGIEAVASIDGIGWREVSVHVAVRPTPRALEIVGAHRAGLLAGEAWAEGWLERLKGLYLQSFVSLFRCRSYLLPVLAGSVVPPRGYAAHGPLVL